MYVGDALVIDNNDCNDGWCQVQRRSRTSHAPKSRTAKQETIAPPVVTPISSGKVAPLAPLIFASNTDAKSLTALPTSRHANFERSFERSNHLSPRDGRRYCGLREVSDIIGFVVNIHDATNFDIDLQLPIDIQYKYCTVITNQYSYKDLGNRYLTNPSDIMGETIVPEVGTTYRCRLRGIGINQLPASIHMRKSHAMAMDIKQLIERTDCWISCTLSDIDVYQRLLVDICVHTSDGCINIKDYLLEKMQEEESRGEKPIFYPYVRERHTTNFY